MVCRYAIQGAVDNDQVMNLVAAAVSAAELIAAHIAKTAIGRTSVCTA